MKTFHSSRSIELVWVQGDRVLLKGTNTLVEAPRQKVKYIPTSVCSSDLMSTTVSTRQGTSWAVPQQGGSEGSAVVHMVVWVQVQLKLEYSEQGGFHHRAGPRWRLP